MVAIPRPMGSLEAFRRSRARRARETSANRGKNTALGPAMGQSMRMRMLHCDYWAGITALTDWDGHHAAAPRTHRCNQWHRDVRSTGSSDDPPKCRSTAGCYPPSPTPPLAVLCCCKPQIFPPRPRDLSAATTLGPQRTSTSVPRMLCRRL